MADEDTFDIDIYGDEDQAQASTDTAANVDEDQLFDDEHNAAYGFDESTPTTATLRDDSSTPRPQSNTPQTQPSQGTKRKASDEDDDANPTTNTTTTNQQQNFSHPIPTNPSALPALKLTDLHWWTTEDDLRALLALASSESSLRDISFGEHKINGKSRGEAYLEFSSASAADAVKSVLEDAETVKAAKIGGSTMRVAFCGVGNPYKGRDSGASGKKEFVAAGPGGGGRGGGVQQGGGGYGGGYQRGGYQGWGGFGGRGGGGQGGFGGRGGFQGGNGGNMGSQGWGMNGGGNGGGNAGMFGAMGRGGMNPMMGRGGFGGGMNPMMNMGMNMANMANMMGRGGMNMAGMMNMGRGGMMGMPQGGGGGFPMGTMNQGQNQNQGPPNKRMKEG